MAQPRAGGASIARTKERNVQGRTTTDWLAVALLVSAGVFAAIHVGKLPPALPIIRAELGFGLVAGGFALSVFSALGMTVSVVLGGMADRLGRKRVVLGGILALATGGALAALTDWFAVLLISRATEGIGFIAISVALPTVVFATASARNRPVVLAMWSVYTPLGMALAMFAAPAALGVLGWRGMWWAIVLLCPIVAGAVLWAMNRVQLPPVVTVNPLRLAGEAMKCRGFWMIALAFLAYAFQWVTIMVWMPTFLTESMGVDLASAASITAVVVLLNVPGCLVGGWFLRRGASARSQIYLGSVVMGLSAAGLLLPLLPDPGRIALAGLFSLLAGLIPPSLFNMVPRVAPYAALVGAGNGMLLQGSATGQFVGAPLVAFVVARAGGTWSVALVPMLAACAVTLIAGWTLGRVAEVRPRHSTNGATSDGPQSPGNAGQV